MSVPIANPALLPPSGLRPAAPAPLDVPERARGTANAPATRGPAFAEVLQKAGGEPLRFSRHAQERVQRRGIPLDSSTLSRLQEGVGRAAGKGSRDCVVLVDGTAFVVGVGSRTVVTAVGAEHMREQVFTNIDSAVIA
jgi:flagellar operon protein